jgi:hypothetical protein
MEIHFRRQRKGPQVLRTVENAGMTGREMLMSAGIEEAAPHLIVSRFQPFLLACSHCGVTFRASEPMGNFQIHVRAAYAPPPVTPPHFEVVSIRDVPGQGKK